MAVFCRPIRFLISTLMVLYCLPTHYLLPTSVFPISRVSILNLNSHFCHDPQTAVPVQ
jgi:hypothetical protein